jgi:hypothetical protein
MSWQERDWAKRKDEDHRERPIRREMEGAFPSPIREDAAWEKSHGDHERAERFASFVQLVDTVREKVGAFLSGCNVRTFQEAAMTVEILHKLTIAAHNARHIDGEDPGTGGPPDEDDDGDE